MQRPHLSPCWDSRQTQCSTGQYRCIQVSPWHCTWVVLPEPVSPTTTTTWFSLMTCSSSSRQSYTGRKRRCSCRVLLLAQSLIACNPHTPHVSSLEKGEQLTCLQRSVCMVAWRHRPAAGCSRKGSSNKSVPGTILPLLMLLDVDWIRVIVQRTRS